MELNYKLCEATLHDSLTKRRSSDRTELNAIINIATDFAQLNFILDRFKRLAIGKHLYGLRMFRYLAVSHQETSHLLSYEFATRYFSHLSDPRRSATLLLFAIARLITVSE